MDLKKLFNTERNTKTKEVFEKYKKMIDMAAPEAKLKAAIKYMSELSTERQKLFSQQKDPGSFYFHIEDFICNCYNEFVGLYNNYNEEFEKAKKKDLDIFKGHDFLPRVRVFLKQSDEMIIKKIAHYFAYNDAYLKLSELKEKFLTDQDLNGTGSKLITKNIDHSKNIKEKTGLEELFLKSEYYYTATEIIEENFIDNEGKWKGSKGSPQELGAMVDALNYLGYLNFSNKYEAICLFGNKYSFNVEERTARLTGNIYKNFYDRCIAFFPKIS